MAEIFQVIGLDIKGDRVIDAIVEDDAGDGPEFFANSLLHATGVVCAQIFPVGAPGQMVTALVTRCDPGVDLETVLEAGL